MILKTKPFAMLLAMAAALSLTGCSDDVIAEPGGDQTEESGKVVYFTTAISLPNGTRSMTDDGDDYNSDADPDFEVGHAYENDVRSLLLVITGENGEFVTSTVVEGVTQAPVNNTMFGANGEIKHQALVEAYKKDGPLYVEDATTETKVTGRIYAFCNYTEDLIQQIGKAKTGDVDWLNYTGQVVENASPAGHTPTITNTIWASRSFLMSNAETTEVKFPGTIEDWDEYADKNNPYDLTDNAIKVERTAARIDFKDGSDGDNTYPLISIYTAEKKDNPEEMDTTKLNLFSVKLTRMALVNMSKDFYYLRRVSDTASVFENRTYTVGGTETFDLKKTPYVADVDWAKKMKGYTTANVDSGFNFTAFKKDSTYNTTGWYVDNIKDVLQKQNDNYKNNDYHIWRYVTENTLPDVASQQTKQSTGVVFKASIIAGEDIAQTYPNSDSTYASKEVQDALSEAANPNSDPTKLPTLYSFNNMLYAGVADLVKAAINEGEGSPLYYAVNEALANWYLTYTPEEFAEGDTIKGEFVYAKEKPTATGKEVKELNVLIYNDMLTMADEDINDAEKKYDTEFFACEVSFEDKSEDCKIEDIESQFIQIAPTYKLTVYKASDENDGEGWGYYCYYFYWNRHNDNNKSGQMGVMEFATVRNNVYKLSVKTISKLGHPRVTGFDPDPVDPDDPDEEDLNYIKVQVNVLPWVVRINEIEF